MKKIRVICIILTIIWMAIVFKFSNEPKLKTENTSSSVTQIIVKIIYGQDLENFEEKVKEVDPLVRKLAHYTLYVVGGFFISGVIFTYNMGQKNKFIISQSIRKFLCTYRRNSPVFHRTEEVAKLQMYLLIHLE